MPYLRITYPNESSKPVRRVSWADVSFIVPAKIMIDMRSILSSKDKWTVFNYTSPMGMKISVANGREVLESK